MTNRKKSRRPGTASGPSPHDLAEIGLTPAQIADYTTALENPEPIKDLRTLATDQNRAYLHSAIDRLFEQQNGGNRDRQSEQALRDLGVFLRVALPLLDIEIGRNLAGAPRDQDASDMLRESASSWDWLPSLDTEHRAAVPPADEVEAWAQAGEEFRRNFGAQSPDKQQQGLFALIRMIGVRSGYQPLSELGEAMQALRAGVQEQLFQPIKNTRTGNRAYNIRIARLTGLACRDFFHASGLIKSRGAGTAMLVDLYSVTDSNVEIWGSDLKNILGRSVVERALGRAVTAGTRFKQLAARRLEPDGVGLADDEDEERLHYLAIFGPGALANAAAQYRCMLSSNLDLVAATLEVTRALKPYLAKRPHLAKRPR